MITRRGNLLLGFRGRGLRSFGLGGGGGFSLGSRGAAGGLAAAGGGGAAADDGGEGNQDGEGEELLHRDKHSKWGDKAQYKKLRGLIQILDSVEPVNWG